MLAAIRTLSFNIYFCFSDWSDAGVARFLSKEECEAASVVDVSPKWWFECLHDEKFTCAGTQKTGFTTASRCQDHKSKHRCLECFPPLSCRAAESYGRVCKGAALPDKVRTNSQMYFDQASHYQAQTSFDPSGCETLHRF